MTSKHQTKVKTRKLDENDKEKQKQILALQKNRKKRLIVRNLSFKVDEELLKETFSKYGNVTDVNIPCKPDGKKRGFAFVQFDSMKSVITAMKALNYQEICGRPVAIDYAISKTQYEIKMKGIKQEKGEDSVIEQPPISIKDEPICEDESEKDDGDEEEMEIVDEKSKPKKHVDTKVQIFFDEFDAGMENTEMGDASESSSSKSSEDEDDDEPVHIKNEDDNERVHIKREDDDVPVHIKKEDDNEPEVRNKHTNRKTSNDVSEGKTVFIRNVPFNVCEEDLEELAQQFGKFTYCLMCRDKITDYPKGTAFVKFKNKEDADKMLEKATSETGIFLEGRKLNCNIAISREDVKKKQEEKAKQPLDRRNLNLLKFCAVMPNSKEAEGVSETDMKKRIQLEQNNNRRLKNVNFFVSDKRLTIHNLPPNFTDKGLRQLFKNTAGLQAFVTEARIMKDLKKTDDKGNARSRGFGFVCFTRHEDALKALQSINNNPSVFSAKQRPIVSFSIENKMALITKERRRERSKLRNKNNDNAEAKPEDKEAKTNKKHNRKWKQKKNAQKKSQNTGGKINLKSDKKLKQKGKNKTKKELTAEEIKEKLNKLQRLKT